MTTTRIEVTLDGRILIWQNRNLIELVALSESRDLFASLTEAIELQRQIQGDDNKAACTERVTGG